MAASAGFEHCRMLVHLDSLASFRDIETCMFFHQKATRVWNSFSDTRSGREGEENPTVGKHLCSHLPIQGFFKVLTTSPALLAGGCVTWDPNTQKWI